MFTADKFKCIILSRFSAAIFVFLFILLHVEGAPLRNVPQQITQPDGTVLHCYASGDEFHNWLHDSDGFTIIQDQETGFFVYADEVNGRLVPTPYIAGSDDPASAGLQPHTNISPDKVMRKRDDFYRLMEEVRRKEFDGVAKSAYRQSSFDVMNNIVIFIRFSDEEEFQQQLNFYEDLYNKQGDDVLSLFEYYQEASYGQLEIFSHFYPVPPGQTVVSYQDAHPRAYYRQKSATNPVGYEGQREHMEREHTLLRNAVQYVESQIPSHINLDSNNDGMVDAVTFIVRGTPEGWNDILWPHQWQLHSQEVIIHGKRVWLYSFLLEVESEITNSIMLGTIAHEMFHVLGAPDLYRYDDSGLVPVGPWDLMGWAASIPPHMNAYMKYLYGGWIDEIPTITQSGRYELSPLHFSQNNRFKIPSANSPYEFFIAEYRSFNSRFEQVLPGEGLLVYRINKMSEGFGNFYTPDEVYVYRPNGTLTSNGEFWEAHYSSNVGRTAISDHTSPSAFLSDGSPSGLQISNIGNTGQTISFDVTIDYDPPVIVRHDGGSQFYVWGFGEAGTIEVGIRLTEDELSGYYGRDLAAIVVCIDEGSGNDVTLKIWEGGSHGNAGTLVHSQNIKDEIQVGGWSAHNLTNPVKLQQGKEYWVGYSINATGGYPVVYDGGPAVYGKSAWINLNNEWVNLHEHGFNNFRIWAVIGTSGTTGTAILNIAADALDIEVYPGQTRSTSLSISNPGTAELTYSISATGGESAVSKISIPDLPRSGLHKNNKMSPERFSQTKERIVFSQSIEDYDKILRPAYPSTEKVLILDDGDNFPDGFLGSGIGTYFYWRNDFQLDRDFDLEKIRFYMKTENINANPVEILVAGPDGSFLFDASIDFDLSSMGKWYEFQFPQDVLSKLQFKTGETFTLIVGALNPNINQPAGYDADGLKPGCSHFGYFAHLFDTWLFSGWTNLNNYFPNGAFLIRAVGNSGTIVDNQIPVAIAQVSPNPAGVNQTVIFNGESSYDPDGHITNYLWEFGDGQTSNQMNTTHSYSQAGQYTYRLTVTDNDGATGQTSGQISITDAPSRWTIHPTSGAIAAGSFRDITITFNSEGLAEGNYQGQLNISSNAGSVVIPVNILISTAVSVDEKPAIVYSYKLEQNYPNPFNPVTIISWELKSEEIVTLRIFDITGKEIATLVNERMDAGRYEIYFSAANLSSGVYLYRITAGDFTDVKRMIYLK